MKAVYFGFNPPFLTDSGVVMQQQTDERLIKNDLLQLLLTVPGERAFRPLFGSTVKSTLFEQLDQFTSNNLRNSVIDAINNNEPRVKLGDVRVELDEDNNIARIKVFASLTINPNIQFQLDVNLPFGIQ